MNIDTSPHQEKIKVYSNYGDGLLYWGKEELITNYMELSEDPKGDWRDEIKLSDNNTLLIQEICPRSSQFVAQSGWIM